MMNNQQQNTVKPKWILVSILIVIIPTLVFSPFLLGFAGEYLVSNQNYETAINLADFAVKLRSNYSYPYSVRAKAYQGMGDLDRALKEYHHAIDRNLDEWVYYSEMGNIYRMMGRSEDAIASYKNPSKYNQLTRMPTLIEDENMLLLAIIGKLRKIFQKL